MASIKPNDLGDLVEHNKLKVGEEYYYKRATLPEYRKVKILGIKSVNNDPGILLPEIHFLDTNEIVKTMGIGDVNVRSDGTTNHQFYKIKIIDPLKPGYKSFLEKNLYPSKEGVPNKIFNQYLGLNTIWKNNQAGGGRHMRRRMTKKNRKGKKRISRRR